jgi:hypothetical protein
VKERIQRMFYTPVTQNILTSRFSTAKGYLKHMFTQEEHFKPQVKIYNKMAAF